MAADFFPSFNNVCQLVTQTRNRYGDYVQGVTVDVECVFRHITTIRRGNHMEVDDADAMLWVPVDTDISIGQIVLFQGGSYQVERYTEAQGLRDEPQFIKCDLKIVKQAIS